MAWFNLHFDEKTDTRLAEAYRHTFARDETTVEVLAHILHLLKMFKEHAEDQYDMALINVGKQILYHLGVYRDGNSAEIVNALLSVARITPKNQKNRRR